MAAKFEVKNSKNGEFFFNLKAGNGEVILTGETYTTRQAALDGIESIRKNSQIAAQFERKIATNGQPFFSLKASNGQTLGKSEMYSGNAALENGIVSVMKNATEARVDDRSGAAA